MSGESAELLVVRRSTSAQVVQAITEDYFLAWARQTWMELSEFRPGTNVYVGNLVEEMAKLAIFLSFNHRERISSSVVEELFDFVRKLPQVALEYAAATAYGYESWEETGLVAPDLREAPTGLSGKAFVISLAKDAQEAASIARDLHEGAQIYCYQGSPMIPDRPILTPIEVGNWIWDLVQVELVISNTFTVRERIQVITHQILEGMLNVIGPFFDSQLKAAQYREPVHLID